MTEFETEKLLARWIAGDSLTAAEMDALKTALESDPAFLDHAAEQIAMDRLLEHRVVGAADFAGRVGEELAPKRKVVPLYRSPKFCAGVAAVALLGWALDVAFHPLVSGRGGQVAEVTGSTGVDGFPENGRSFSKGERIAFDSGFVSLRFNKGAELILEGKAELEFTGDNRAKLIRGSAVANVPESAHGFTIDGPGGKVVDLGTEFAVKAEGGEMEVHVLKGEVEAKAKGHKAVALTQDKALRLGKSGAAGLTVSPVSFLTALPPKHGSAALDYLHWPFDENQGGEARAIVRGFPESDDTTGRFSSLPGGSAIPHWTKGVFGSGVAFGGQDDYVQTEFPGFGGSSARTVACWVKVPQDLKLTEGYALVSWGAHNTPGDTWQVSINPDKIDGPVGSLRCGTHEGEVVGSTDLRDGQWHHVAAVLYEGRPANVSTHILLYVDGRLEPAARKSVMRINTDITGPMAQKVSFGKNSAVRTAENKMPKHTFRGDLDEVTLCPAALSQGEIRKLMENGRIE
ncbi:MAG TPA: LamG-like jellyroll fold domain-containing protein [Luteolibacter sp.]|nr:LamG-like jellyroll fold domain-containing protein [Luteolibacter sp.]